MGLRMQCFSEQDNQHVVDIIALVFFGVRKIVAGKLSYKFMHVCRKEL